MTFPGFQQELFRSVSTRGKKQYCSNGPVSCFLHKWGTQQCMSLRSSIGTKAPPRWRMVTSGWAQARGHQTGWYQKANSWNTTLWPHHQPIRGRSSILQNSLKILPIKSFPWKSSGSLSLLNMCACVLSHFSHVWLCDAMKCSLPAPLPIRFSRQECFSGLPCPPLRDLPHLEIEFSSLMFPTLAGEFFTISQLGSSLNMNTTSSLLNLRIKHSLLQIETYFNNT